VICNERVCLRHERVYYSAMRLLRVVRPDAVCEVQGLTPGLSYESWGFFPGGGQTEKFYTGGKQKTHRGRPLQSACRGWSVPTK